MGSDLVAFGNHSLDQRFAVVSENALPVVAVEEEGGVDVVVSQQVQDLVGIDIGAVVKGQRDGSRYGAASYNGSQRHRGAFRQSERISYSGRVAGRWIWAAAGPWGDAAPRLGAASGLRAGHGKKSIVV